MGSSVACFVNCLVQFWAAAAGGRVIFLAAAQIRGAHLGNSSLLTFSPFLWQWQSFLSQNPFLCQCLGKGQRENGKVLKSGDLGSLLEAGDSWMGLLLGPSFTGCGLELGRASDKKSRRGKRQTEGESKPHLFKSLWGLPFSARGVSIWVS